MSLSSHAAPNAVSMGSAWAPQQGMPQPNVPLRDNGPSGMSNRGEAGSAQEDQSRGELTGDQCSTIDLFGANPSIAMWSEESNQCKHRVWRNNTVVHFSAEGQANLARCAEHNNKYTAQDLRDGVSIGGAGQLDSVGSCFPLPALLDLDFVPGHGKAPLEPNTSLPLPMLTALLLDGALLQGKDLISHKDASAAPRKGKGKKGGRNKSLTLICPAGFNQAQRATLTKAAEQCGRTVKNVFNRGVAVVTGALHQASLTAASSAQGSKGRVAVAGDLLDVLCGQGDTHSGEEPVLLYVHVYALQSGGERRHYDAVLVRCEGRAGAAAVGAPLGFERLQTVAARGGQLVGDKSGVLMEMRSVVALLLADAGLADNTGAVKAVVLEGLISEPAAGKGPVDRSALWSDGDALSLLTTSATTAAGNAEVVRAEPHFAVVGGCVLSAAELSSSKQYLQRAEGKWAIAYQFPVADGAVLGRELGVRVEWQPGQEPQEEAVFKLGTRLWKEDLGPIPPRPSGSSAAQPDKGALGTYRREFKRGAVEVTEGASKRTLKPPPGWPRVQIVERADPSAGSAWRVLETLTPLLSCASASDAAAGAAAAAGGAAEAVESCVLEVRVDPATGAVCATQSKGRTLSQGWAVFWERLQLAFVLLLPFILIALWYCSGYVSEWYSARQASAWLQDFYQKNAPEKLQDGDYVARTLAKYKGRMFLLWRNLERSYKVKWPAPPGILDGAAE